MGFNSAFKGLKICHIYVHYPVLPIPDVS